MKRKFTFLTATLMLLAFLAIPFGVRGQSDYSSDYTGNITLSTTGGSNASACVISISGTSYNGIKAGTSSKAGAVMITVPSGTKYLHLHAAAWNNTTASLAVTPTGYSDDIELTANTGIANNSPFTFSGDPSTSDYYKVITFSSALTADTDLTFTAVGGKRFVIWGVTSEVEGGSLTPSITAANVEIDYDATSGSIDYTINNAVSGGVLSANTASEWLTLGTVGSAAVPFTCTANDGVERTATVTLTYNYGSENVFKNVTVTQEANPNGPGSQANPYTVAQARAAIDANSGTQGVYATGIVSAIPTAYSTQFSNITFNMVDNTGDEEYLQAYRCSGTEAANVMVGDIVVVTGNLTKYNSTYEFAQGCEIVSLTHTVTPHDLTFGANPTEGGTVTVGTYTSPATIAEGTTTDITATPNTGYAFSGWEVTGAGSSVADATSATTTFTMGTADATLTANFTPVNTYTVTYYPNVTGTAPVEFTYNEGEDVTVANNTFYNPGHAFSGWNTDPAGSGNSYSPGDVITNIGTDYDLYAQWIISSETTDVLNWAATGSPTNYTDWTYTAPSGTAYAGQSSGTYQSIQLRSNNDNSGIVTTTSIGNATKVVVTWNSNTVAGRTLNIYGKNTAYSEATDLYGANAGELLGTIVCGTSTEFNITGGYAYIGIRSASGAIYLDEIDITWNTSGVMPASITVTPTTVNVPVGGGSGTLTVTYENITTVVSDVFFCEADGTTAATYSWIVADIDASNNVEYIVDNNTGDARTAYLKVYALDDDSNDVYSDLVTINQAANVPTFAVIFDVDGGTFVPNSVFTDEIIEVAAGTYDLPSATKAGTNFAGWLLDGTTDIYAAGASFEVTADVSFTAQWSNALTGTIHFCSTAGTGNMNVNASPKEGTDDLGNTWTVTTEGTTSFTPSNLYCQIGASSKPATSITFTTTLPTDVTITAFEAKFGGFSGTAGDVSLTVGTTEVATGSLNATTDVIVGGPVAAYGKVLTVTVTNIAKGVKAYYISYSYEMTTDPIINAPATVELPYDATSGQINYTIVNPVAGKSLGATTTASWISNIVVTDEKVSFTTTANDGTDDRVATFTLTYEGAADKTVTVTQAHFVADYATLPFAFDAGRADIENVVGLTQEGLDTDYGSSPKLKFNTTGDWVILKLNEAPTSLSYTLKGNSTSNDGGVFSVQTSADGVDYVDLAEYVTTTLNNKTFTYTHIDLNANVRYIKWIYTNKSNGNVALGNIHATTNYDIYGTVTVASLSVPATKTCTIYEGGQLIHGTGTIPVTMVKHVKGYTGEKDNYYLITVPFNDVVDPTTVTGMTTGNFDLYEFHAWEPGQEWANFEAQNSFDFLQPGVGYLYAKDTDIDLEFTGTINPSTDYEYYMGFNNDPTAPFDGWEIVGNPFACNTYITGASTTGEGMAFYRMNTDGNGFTAATGAIKPLEGVLVQATAVNQSFTFTRTAPVTSFGHGNLNLSLAQVVTNRGEQPDTDNAIIRFDGGSTLEKYSFRENTAKLYITQNGKDYSVVNSEAQGEMPVKFKAAKNGTYTLSITTENIEFGYLHLIDNMTANDVDLLQTPSYTFEAKTSDYASRFKLVFSANGNDDINASEQIAFINNGEIILNGINGNTTVQLFDITGRMLSSTNGANRISTENVAAGVYMLRLINGSDVKTQKIIVK